jgi:Protein of unknown function (DUF2000)
MADDVITHKFTLALRKNGDEQLLLEAAAKVALALGTRGSDRDVQDMRLLEFEDAGGWKHTHISALSLIVMKAKAGELERLRATASEAGLPVAFAQDPAGELAAVMAFGEKAVINPMTARLSLWK